MKPSIIGRPRTGKAEHHVSARIPPSAWRKLQAYRRRLGARATDTDALRAVIAAAPPASKVSSFVDDSVHRTGRG